MTNFELIRLLLVYCSILLIPQTELGVALNELEMFLNKLIIRFKVFFVSLVKVLSST